MAAESPASAPSAGWRGQLGRYVLLSAAVIVFAACLVLSFKKAALQDEAALRDAGAALRLAFVADHEMQQLRHGLDLYALGGKGVDSDTLQARHRHLVRALHRLADDPDVGASGEVPVGPVPDMIEDLVDLELALAAFRPGDPQQYAELAGRLDEIAAPLRQMVAATDTDGMDEAERAVQRRWLYMEEMLYLLGMLGSGGVFIAMLLRESRRTRRLLAEATAAQGRIEHLAHHDPLTDLPNRWLFKDRLDQALRLAQRQHGMLAMHCIDIDYFKKINDCYGHVTGDKVLVAVAARMQDCLRQSDTLARLGGDEFAIVQTAAGENGAAYLAERLLEAFRAPLVADGHEMSATVSIGIALYPIHATTAEALHRAADAALYCAKADGRDRYHEWQPGDDQADSQVSYRAVAS